MAINDVHFEQQRLRGIPSSLWTTVTDRPITVLIIQVRLRKRTRKVGSNKSTRRSGCRSRLWQVVSHACDTGWIKIDGVQRTYPYTGMSSWYQLSPSIESRLLCRLSCVSRGQMWMVPFIASQARSVFSSLLQCDIKRDRLWSCSAISTSMGIAAVMFAGREGGRVGGVAGWQSDVEIEDEEKVEGKTPPKKSRQMDETPKRQQAALHLQRSTPLEKNIRKKPKRLFQFFFLQQLLQFYCESEQDRHMVAHFHTVKPADTKRGEE